MIPKLIHFTVPADLTKEQKKNLERAKEALPGYEFKIWQDPVQKEGFRLSRYWQKASSGAQLADLIRLEVVYKYGGVYLDSDIKVHKSFDGLLDEEFFIASEDGEKLTNAIFGARRESDVLNSLIESLLEDEPDWNRSPDITTGPGFFARQLKWDNEVTVLPRETFYAYNWDEDPEGNHPAAIVTHTWKGSWLEGESTVEPKNESKSLFAKSKNYIKRKIKKLVNTDKKSSYTASGNICTETSHGYNILLDGNDLSITPQIVQNGYYEKNEEIFVRDVLSGGDYFVDVGANVGMFTLLAARQVGPFGRVFAFEPNPSVAALLRKSAAMNWLHDRIVVREIAIAEDDARSKLKFSDSRLGDGGIDTGEDDSALEKTATYLDESKTIETQIRTLDSILHLDVPIKILKIDVEGLEAEVIRGASRLIKNKCVDYIMVEAVNEVSGDRWLDTIEVIRMLTEGKYTPYSFDGGRLTSIDISDVRYDIERNSRNIVLVSDWV